MRILNLNCYRRLILVALIALFPFRVWAYIGVYNVNVTQAGKLGSLLTSEEKNTIQNLCVTGNLNGSDIVVLQDMANASMTYLDLQNANIVTGGDAYYIWTSSYTQSYNTKANVIGAYMFYRCTSLRTVYLPNSVTTIESGAFGYSSLKSMTIGPKVTSITAGLCAGTPLDKIALNGNTSFVLENGILYDKAKTTVYKAVTGIEGDITLPSTVSTIMNSSFSETGLRSIIIPSKVTEITTATFSNCQNLEDVTFPSGLTDLGYDCFGHCPKLKKVDLSGTKVTKIYMSFYNCQNLEEIILPSTLKEITGSSFTSSVMKKITCNANTPPTLVDASYHSFPYDYIASSCKVYVPKGRVSYYKTATGWKRFYYINEIGSEPEDDSLEAYAVYTDDCTLTFYYDNQKDSRSGTKYSLNIDSDQPGWHKDHRKDIKKVVFDSSFAGARPTSTYEWFGVGNSIENSVLSEIVGIEYLNTADVTTMHAMFFGCSNLKSLDISHFDTRNVSSMRYMFWGCSSLTNLDVTGFDTSKVTSMDSMFGNCSGLTNLDISGFNTINVTNMGSMFADCSGLTILDISHFDTGKVTYMRNMFAGCSSLTILDVSHFDTSKVTDMGGMFSNCKNLTNLDMTHFNTSNVTTMNSMFAGCSGLKSLDVTLFNTSKVQSMASMFEGCGGLKSLDVTYFDTGVVWDMESMFADCSGLMSIDVTRFNTSNVWRMGGMFYNCKVLRSLDLSNFDTSNVQSTHTEMLHYGMFQNCTNLSTIYVGESWDMEKVTPIFSENMFLNCISLVGGAGTTYDSNYVDVAYAHIDGGPSNPGYLTGIDAQQGELPTTGCDEDWLQKKLDEIAAQKPSEPVELTICEDGITLTKSILVAKDCKAVLTGGPITSEAFIDYRHGAEGVFMVYGELGFHDISLTFNNDAKNDGCLGYFWLGDGTLKMQEKTVVNTTNGTVVGGWGRYELKGGTIFAGGNEMVIASNIEADISGSVTFIGAQTYCNGRLSLDLTFSDAGYAQIPTFRVSNIYVTSTLDIWAPLSTLSVYLYKDATINTVAGGIAVLSVDGEWDKMTAGRAIITSTSITQEDYEGMTFANLPTNLKADFEPEEHQVQLVMVGERNIQNDLDGLVAGDQTTPIVIDVASDVVSVLSQPATVSHANVTFNGMLEGSASRGRLHFEKDQTLTVSQGSLMTLTNLDVTGEGGSESFVVLGQLVIGENVHVSGFTCLLSVQNGGCVGVSGPLVSTITLRYVNGLTDGQTVIVGTDGYQLTEQDLSLVSVEDCELKLDMTNNRIVAVNPTSIREIEKSSSEMAGGYYDLSGRHVLAPRQGVYIMKSEGKTRKVYVK